MADYLGSLFPDDTQATAPTLQALSPQARDSLLQSMANYGTSGLHALGTVLDTFGRPVRTALAGNWADVLPSIISPSRAVSGEDLAQQWGLLNAGSGPVERFLVGMGTQLATDPLSYINPLGPLVGGTLNEAGQAAKLAGRVIPRVGQTTEELAQAAQAAGKLAPTLASRIAAGQGGLFGIGLPFSESALTLGTGPTAQAVAQGVGDVYGAIGRTLPFRAAKAMLQKNVQGSTSPFLQQVLPAAAEAARPREAEAQMAVSDLARSLGPDAGVSEVPAYQQQLAASGLDPSLITGPNDVMRGINEGTIQPIPGTKLGDVGQAFSDWADYLPVRGEARGIKAADLAGYAPRELNPAYKTDVDLTGRLGVQPASLFQTSDLSRKVPDQFIIGRTLGLQKMSLDPDVAGAVAGGTRAADDVRDTILQRYMGVAPDALDFQKVLEQTPPSQRTPAQQTQLDQLTPRITDAEKLTDIMGKLDPAKVQAGVPFYNPDYFGPWAKRLTSAGRTEELAGAIIDGLNSVAKPMSALGPDAVPLSDVLAKSGFGDMALGLAKDPNAYVPKDIADTLRRYVQSFTQPETVQPLLQGIRASTNIFRSLVSTMFPASRSRDFMQGQFMNFVKGLRDPRYLPFDPRAYYQPVADAISTFLIGGTVDGAETIPAVRQALGDVSPAIATKYVADQANAWGLIKPGEVAPVGEAKGITVGGKPAQYTLPGTAQPLLQGIMQGASWRPWDVYGVGARTETQFLPAKIGGRAIEAIDTLNRGSAYYSALRQGASFDEAARMATEAAYDYGNLSKFERSFMQQVVPFYNFMRQNVPAQLEELVKRPGGTLAQTVRATDVLRQQQGFVPQQVGEGLAIPAGTEDNGTQRYISHFGLPYEEALGPIVPGNLQETLQQALSETNPLIRAPIELASGKQMWSGRDLRDLYGSTGNAAVDQLLYNAPWSRLIKTGRTLIDPRKGLGAKALNLLSPVQVTDVDMQKARNVAARQGLEETLLENPAVRQFTKLSVRPEDLAQLDPQQRLLLQLYKSLQTRKPAASAAALIPP